MNDKPELTPEQEERASQTAARLLGIMMVGLIGFGVYMAFFNKEDPYKNFDQLGAKDWWYFMATDKMRSNCEPTNIRNVAAAVVWVEDRMSALTCEGLKDSNEDVLLNCKGPGGGAWFFTADLGRCRSTRDNMAKIFKAFSSPSD